MSNESSIETTSAESPEMEGKAKCRLGWKNVITGEVGFGEFMDEEEAKRLLKSYRENEETKRSEGFNESDPPTQYWLEPEKNKEKQGE